MNVKILLKNHGYPCLLTMLLCIAVLSFTNNYFGLRVNEEILLLLVFFWVVILRCFDHIKKNVLPYLVLLIFAVTIVFLCFLFDISFSKIITSYTSWFHQTLSDGKSNSIGYSAAAIILLLIITSILIYLLQKKHFTRIIGAVIAFCVLLFLGFTEQLTTKLVVVSLLFYIFLTLVEIRITFFYKKDRSVPSMAMTFLVPCGLLLSLILLILPASENPIEWKTIKRCITAVSDSVETLVTNIDLWIHPDKKEFNLNFAGYSEESKVGGSISESEELAISLKTSSLNNIPVYLNGNVKNKFDGEKWEDIVSYKKEEYTEAELDSLELLYAIDREGLTEDYSSVISTRSYSVTYEGISTRTLFYPLKVLNIGLTSRKDAYSDDEANLRFHDIKSKGVNYSFQFMNLNLDSNYFNKLIENQARFQYQNENVTSFLQFRDNIANKKYPITYKVSEQLGELLKLRRDRIYEDYLNVYEGLPKRVSDLAFDITKNCRNDYEKCKVIEKFFANYTYSTIPKQPEEGHDLVDYLIFESKEGYCTYYATAFAMMARCVGIPTRYVQGFRVPQSEEGSQYSYYVYNKNAHAWPEAYIEGIGWIPFEPTPSFYDYRYQPWSSDKGIGNGTVVTPSIGAQYDPYNYQKLLEQEEREFQTARNTYRSISMIAGIVVLLILFGVFLYYMLRIQLFNRSYRKANLVKRVYQDIKAVLLMAEFLGKGIENSETFQCFIKRLVVEHSMNEIEAESIIDIFQKIRYNEEEPSIEEQQKIECFRNYFASDLKRTMKNREYLRLRLYLLRHERMIG
ncbi:transglutaminaseTgpA domain-containing protein [Lachnoclostridium phytofermentans]|uniref:Transglutaminase domain protein n=1 Tax=Lachnoclostridium phytofermentans (strain ATCC 700394 / DSM 18823 / ISDg) TaxID=357809 RepID=A9KT87_LACP7|nr:transglutaminaseTgpA domain-containing protein [Lachnoclostridium phytofermentans]ABX43717.1 transglutaminase domain protein [Lachnoclostridium phytofermentans ISDg]